MQNPWDLDPDEIPEDAAVSSDPPQYRALGYLLWGLAAGGIAVLVTVDPDGITPDIAVALGGAVLTTALLAVVLGWVVERLVRRLPTVGKVFVGIGVIVTLLAVLPEVATYLFENVEFFGDVPVDDEPLIPDILPAI